MSYTLLEAYNEHRIVTTMAIILTEGNTDFIEKHAVQKNDMLLIDFLRNCTLQSFTQFYNGSSLLHIATANQAPIQMLELLISLGVPLDAIGAVCLQGRTQTYLNMLLNISFESIIFKP